MQIQALMLGTGTPALRPHRCGSSTLVQIGDENLLIDCGYGSAMRLAENHVRLEDVTRLFFTHHHYDHNVDYPSFVLHSSGRREQLDVYGPVGTSQLTTDLFDRAFSIDLNNRQNQPRAMRTVVSAVEDIDSGFVIEGNHWRLTAERVDHFTYGGNFTLGYRIDTDTGSVAFSGDTMPCDGIRKLAQGADVLVHEVSWQVANAKKGRWPHGKDDVTEDAFRRLRITKHSLPEEVKAIAHEAGVKRLVLTHLFSDEHLDELQKYMQQGLECEVVLAVDHMRFSSG